MTERILHVKRELNANAFIMPFMQTSLAKILCILNFIAIVNLQMRILSLFIHHQAVCKPVLFFL